MIVICVSTIYQKFNNGLDFLCQYFPYLAGNIVSHEQIIPCAFGGSLRNYFAKIGEDKIRVAFNTRIILMTLCSILKLVTLTGSKPMALMLLSLHHEYHINTSMKRRIQYAS